LISYFSDFRYVDLFQRYSRSKSKVVRNREKFWTIFGPPNFFWGGGAGLPKIVPSLSLLPLGTSIEKSFMRILPIVRKLLSLTR